MKKTIILSALFTTIGFSLFAQNNKTTKTKIVDVTLAPPPPDTTILSKLSDGAGMANMMNSMGPMMSNMAKSMMEGQLQYYKQPGKLEEIAHLQKQYFDALVKEGFTADQALKIITSDSLLPKSAGSK